MYDDLCPDVKIGVTVTISNRPHQLPKDFDNEFRIKPNEGMLNKHWKVTRIIRYKSIKYLPDVELVDDAGNTDCVEINYCRVVKDIA